MEYNKILNAQKYLYEFYQILYNMANKMLSARICNNITIFFINCMIPHHQAAIYMCENLLKYTNYEPLQKISKNIIQTQSSGIQQMEEIARTTCGFNNLPNDVYSYNFKYISITRNMICKMSNSPRCININFNFVNEMIPHHEGAVEMCKNLLQYCIDPRLKLVAENIIKEQTEGIRQLEEIRRSL